MSPITSPSPRYASRSPGRLVHRVVLRVVQGVLSAVLAGSFLVACQVGAWTDGAPGPSADSGAPDDAVCAVAATEAASVLAADCASCHGPTSPGHGGFDGVLDVDAMIAEGLVVPGDPDASPLYLRVESGQMPPTGAATAEAQGALHDWIQCGAAPFTMEEPRTFVGDAEVWASLAADLRGRSDVDQANSRYFTLVHLYNAGVPEESLQSYVGALTKAVSSLSWELDAPAPLEVVPVDADLTSAARAHGLLFRVDLRPLGWDTTPVDRWEEMVKAYPYGLVPRSEDADFVRTRTDARLPVLYGDWFAAQATTPPLYFDVMGFPSTRDEFLATFMPRPAEEDLEAGTVDCAGFQESGISENNRVVCRHDAVFGACWLSYDFASSAGEQNIFANPLGFPETYDGGEILCDLRDGLQAYFIHDADGARLDTAPVEIVFDRNEDAAVVETGRSCIRCHDSGPIPKDDEVRDAVLGWSDLFDAETIATVQDWFPEREEMAALYAEDDARYAEALAAIDLVPTDPEPVWTLADAHEQPLDRARVAAELGLTDAEIEVILGVEATVAVQVTSLAEGGTIPRATFNAIVGELACACDMGRSCEAESCGASLLACMPGQTCTAAGACQDE